MVEDFLELLWIRKILSVYTMEMAMQTTHSFSFVPILKLAEEIFRPCGELELVGETKKPVDMIEEVE